MNSSKYFAVFCVEALYYLPHFLPVADEMKRRGLPHAWLFYNEAEKFSASETAKLGIERIKAIPEQAGAIADFVIFGNGYENLVSVPGITVLIYHGIGTKSCYYDYDLNEFKIRFVEGDYRRRELDSRSPETKQERPVVGFSKLDPAVRFSAVDRESSLLALGLKPSRKTVLYAPTYYPSSIELMNKNFPEDCSDLNVIIKPHQFTYSAKYKKQVQVLEHWKKRSNVYLTSQEEFNILPFFAISDVMISDESSAIFEFAALGRPVIRNRFVKLRLSYRLFPSKLRKRMDADIERYSGVAQDAHDYNETLLILQNVIAHQPVTPAGIKHHLQELLGEVDGKASERMIDYLVARAHPEISQR
jgi:hypothetical protein